MRLKSRQKNNRGRPRAAFVISMGGREPGWEGRLTRRLPTWVCPYCGGRTTEREAYAVAAGDGQVGAECGRDRAARAEITGICDELQEMCDDLRPKARDVR